MADAVSVANALASAQPGSAAVTSSVAAAVAPPSARLEFPDGIQFPELKNSMVRKASRVYATPTGQSTWTLSAGRSPSELQFQLPTTNLVDSSSFQLQFTATLSGGTTAETYVLWNSGFDLFSKFRIVQGGSTLYETINYNHACAISDMHYETQAQSQRSGIMLEGKMMGVDYDVGGYVNMAQRGSFLGFDSGNTAHNISTYRLNLKDGPMSSRRYLPLPFMSQVQFIWTWEDIGNAIVSTAAPSGTEVLTISDVRLFYKAITLDTALMDGIQQAVVAGSLRMNMIAVESQSINLGTVLSDQKQITWRVNSLNELVVVGTNNATVGNMRTPRIGHYSGMDLANAWFQIGTEYYPPQRMESVQDFFTNLEDVTGNNSQSWDTGRYLGRIRGVPINTDNKQVFGVVQGTFTDGTTVTRFAPNLWFMYHNYERIDFDPTAHTGVNWDRNDFTTWGRNGFCIALSFMREITADVIAGINTAQQSVLTNLIISRNNNSPEDIGLIAFANFVKTWFLTAAGTVVLSF